MQTRWLITQFINNTRRLDEIYIKVEYAITSRCSGSCLTTLDMFVLQANVTDQNFTVNATEFGTLAFTILTDIVRDGQTRISHIRRLTPNLSNAGFYIGFRDMGTCLALFETVVFYAVCDAISFDLGANFTNTGFHDKTYPGECFPNMKINSRVPVNAFTGRCNVLLEQSPQADNLIINWVINSNDSLQCMCLPGYRFVNSNTQKQCEACPPFTFKNTLSNTEMCQPCPLFSNTTESDTAVAVCPCDPGYYRPLDGLEDASPCTRPPSPPQNISFSNLTSTSVFITWQTPVDNGNRSDIFYTISQNVTSTTFNTTDTSITLTGLTPFVYYEIRVTADNGVSSQSNDVENRSEAFPIFTVPRDLGPVSNVTVSDKSITSSELTIWWMPVSIASSVFRHYTVIYSPVRGPYGPIIASNRRKRQSAQTGELTMNFTQNTGTLTNLYGAVTYRIQVAVVVLFNGQEITGDRSVAIEMTTLEGVPTAPHDLRHTGLTDTTVTLTWGRPNPPNGLITQYNVSYIVTISQNERFYNSIILEAENSCTCSVDSSYTWTGLIQDEHQFSVVAFTSKGPGESASLMLSPSMLPNAEMETQKTTVIIALGTLFAIAVIGLVISVVINIFLVVQRKQSRYDVKQSSVTDPKIDFGDVKLDTNPAYEATVKMDTNPAYEAIVD